WDSTRVLVGGLRQATFSSMLIVGALRAPSPPSSAFCGLGPFLPALDEPELVEPLLVPPALLTGWKPVPSPSCEFVEASAPFKPLSESVRFLAPSVPEPASPGAGSA